MVHGIEAEVDFLDNIKSKLHERYLAFWSNYRNLHLMCPMKMQYSDGLQILHSHLSRKPRPIQTKIT